MSFASLGFRMAKPFLHSLDAERAHELTLAGLKTGLAPAVRKTYSSLRTELFGLHFANPVGLAPGFDKNASVPDAMLGLGFGFVEIGTVTPYAQSGNARPRLFRLPEDQAVINRMGFNNDGHHVVRQRLEKRRGAGGIVGVNIGANKDSADRIQDYVEGVKNFSAAASYITINISSPNTPGLRNLQARDDLQRLLTHVNKVRNRNLPMLLKISPDLADDELRDVAHVCGGGAVDGVIISNTTLSRAGLTSPLASEAGGLSGAPLFERSTQCLADFYRYSKGKIPLIGVGGIHDAETAWQKIRSGASLIQLYSALVFKGPQLIADICEGLEQRLKSHKFASIAEAVGTSERR
jgi:dihydroorotate dehydrogenase